MFETKCIKVKLKPGSLERVREWADELNRRKEEALETMRGEPAKPSQRASYCPVELAGGCHQECAPDTIVIQRA